ncbi:MULTISPECIES: hypothetical protein [Calothrix]|uniref:Uncharacterized protein n=2 Tax=Calothrix TaxID=1186 RepID=A0ABR8AE54_9CYAN|nr:MULTISPECIES: hypothetical protein [Calothrix]MBD2198306.1 hypothetical protein [Calothrix parietina FACHB-288]MBD2226631.1 hypothetical protein [Calothrix anomala FACHB-343]
MLNNISKFCSSRQAVIPAAALIITLGVFGEQIKSVLSHPITIDSQNLSGNYLLPKPREVKAQTNKDYWMSENLQQPSAQGSAEALKAAPETTALATKAEQSASGVRNLPVSNLPTEDGLYLYGQSPKPNQLGQGYIIFEKRQATVRGALYMPSSEFSCFQGTIDRSGELAMTVNASPDGNNYHPVATTSTTPNINEDAFTSYPYSVALQDYHQLKSISANDRHILQMCSQISPN